MEYSSLQSYIQCSLKDVASYALLSENLERVNKIKDYLVGKSKTAKEEEQEILLALGTLVEWDKNT